MAKEWYMQEYEEREYLHNKKLEHKEYDGPFCLDDHEHCALCWQKISKYPEDDHSGYYEKDSRDWICEDCFDKFKELFGWELE